ncbi:hypothetical protein AAG906_019373 [Vitis piasezkii]
MEISELCKSNVPTRDYGPIRVANIDRSKVFLLVPRSLDTAGLFPFRPGEDASTGARLGGMSIRWASLVRRVRSREDEEELSRRQRVGVELV